MSSVDYIIATPAFSIVLTVIAYLIGMAVKNKTNHVLANPIIIATALIILVLLGLNIPYDVYKSGSYSIHYLLGPLTVALGIMLYRQRMVIKKYFFSLLIGISSGVLTSFFTILLLGQLLHVDKEMVVSLLPKSITTPMAISLSEIIGGHSVITIVMVIVTGISGAMMAPIVRKLFKHPNPIATGVGIGTASHAVGTSKAIEMGETEGALSSTAIALTGLITVLIVPILYSIFL